MDSSNIHYKSHKVVCSSALNDGSYNYTAAGNPHVWTSNSFLNDDVSIASDEEALMNLRNPRLLQNENLVTSLNPTAMSSTTKDFGLESTCAAAGHFMNHDQDQNNNQLLLQLNSQIKQEVLYPNLYGRLFNFNENNNNGINNNNQSSSAASLEESSNSSSVITSSGSSRQQSCSQIYPTINVSEFLNNNQQPHTQPGGSMGILNYSSSGFGLNFQGLDLFNSAGRGGFGGMISSSFHQPLIQEDDFEFSKINNLPNFGMDFMKQSLENTLESGSGCNLSIDGKLEFLNKRVAELKKNEVINSEAKTGKTQVGKKRSRSVESRACPPLKVFQVRKEKLGDRIAALQQLVAPFGKTDTASVLMEAIGYIKFLQDQVETLSVPYLKSSRHKNNKAAQHGGYVDNKSEEQKQDLRSKGLCLVPLSCLSYVTDGGGAMWPPPHFG